MESLGARDIDGKTERSNGREAMSQCGQRASFNSAATSLTESIQIRSQKSPSKPRHRVGRKECVTESNRIVTSRGTEPIPPRRTKSWLLLSGTCLLWSNEYEKTYYFVDLRGGGYGAVVTRPAGIA